MFHGLLRIRALFASASLLLAAQGASAADGHTGSSFRLLHSFAASDCYPSNCFTPIEATDGNVYGVTSGSMENAGSIYRYDVAGKFQTIHRFALSKLAAGAYPSGPLLETAPGVLYGTTFNGGTTPPPEPTYGTVFKLILGTKSKTRTMVSLQRQTTGAWPIGLAKATGGLMVVSQTGGPHGSPYQTGGVIFTDDLHGNSTVHHSFYESAQDGNKPYARAVRRTDGIWYGTTPLGGIYGRGTVYTVSAEGAYAILYNFKAADGQPYSDLLDGRDGYLYGTTFNGGAAGKGTIYRISPLGVKETLHAFTGGASDGSQPISGVTRTTSGDLVGVTYYGGAADKGVLYRLTIGGAIEILHTFQGGTDDGAYPMATPLIRSTGLVLGTSSRGGANDGGALYSANLP